MKNFKQITFGLLLGSLVIGFSAFTSASKLSIGDVYGETSSGSYTKLTQAYDADKCINTSENTCAYVVTPPGGPNVTANFTTADVPNYLSHNWIQAEDSDNGIYTGL